MGTEYTAKSFKFGNSIAIRMPAALGIEPDREWRVVEQNGELHLTAKPPKPKKLDVDRFWGKAKGLKLPTSREFEERPSTIAARKQSKSE